MKEKALEILEAQRLAKVTAEVLQGLKRSYVASDAATDFATLLREGVDEQQAASRYDCILAYGQHHQKSRSAHAPPVFAPVEARVEAILS